MDDGPGVDAGSRACTLRRGPGRPASSLATAQTALDAELAGADNSGVPATTDSRSCASCGVSVSEKVRDYCRANLTGYKQPRVVEFRKDLPKTPVGKILRRELRDAK